MKRIAIHLLLLVSVLGASSSQADTRLLTRLDILDAWENNFNASHWLEQGNLQSGCQMYGEEAVTITSLPAVLEGADWIQTAYGSKSFVKWTEGPVIAYFTLKHAADVYILHNDAITNKPAWLDAYIKVPGRMTNSCGESFSLYRRRALAGERVALGPNGSTREGMYIVALQPVGEWPEVKRPEGRVFDVTAFGAKGDGRTVNTKAIQAALDKCAASGGGTVWVNGGVFVTGMIELKDNTTLRVEAGSILRGSTELADYPARPVSTPYFQPNDTTGIYQLIFSEKRKNVAITGGGIIDGYSIGEGWPWKGHYSVSKRPYLISMSQVAGLTVTDITLVRPAHWTQRYESCRDMRIERMQVRSYTGTHNQDGIDISSCRNVLLRDYSAITGDDAVCMKSLSATGSDNIRIDGVRVRYANCHLVKIGTETHSDIRNVHVSNVEGWTRYSVAVESADGAQVENILYENIVLHTCSTPLFIRMSNRGRTFEGGPKVAPVGMIRNVTIRNLRNPDIGYTEHKGGRGLGTIIAGIPGHPIENITIEDCDLYLYGSMRNPDLVYADVPEVEKKYPEFDNFGVCPAYGLYIRHVKGITLKNVDIRFKYTDVRPAVVMDDASDYKLENVTVETSTRTEPSPLWDRQRGKIVSE
ncbi:glycoside hydrolase family 28 protein [Gallalistipes aquisgranensis]|uniref:glycoside hydrolase family 28 protein n=1 Tax=Gallalistipes aquisgranensis TaxID=2779358 RepID=UPI001CF85814|nr:glycosyl hydrolase family 28 protein [Gallalistipes aquisgranensis]MBE5032466.1 glycoside hydrolase [Gallalistipes aquisgranensis]